MERGRPDKLQPNLNTLKRLRQPAPHWNFKEWKEERLDGKYHSGFVVGVLLHSERPDLTAIFYDGGRRRRISEMDGIVLEGVYIPTSQVIAQNIQVGDLVKSDWHFDTITKVASLEELEMQGLSTSASGVDWDKIIGVLI